MKEIEVKIAPNNPDIVISGRTGPLLKQLAQDEKQIFFNIHMDNTLVKPNIIVETAAKNYADANPILTIKYTDNNFKKILTAINKMDNTIVVSRARL